VPKHVADSGGEKSEEEDQQKHGAGCDGEGGGGERDLGVFKYVKTQHTANGKGIAKVGVCVCVVSEEAKRISHLLTRDQQLFARRPCEGDGDQDDK